MRWQQLFADLEAQFEAEQDAAERAGAASRTRAEVGAVRLVDRVRGALGGHVVLTCTGAGSVSGELTDTGADWLLVTEERGRECLVAVSAVRAVAGLGRRTAPPEDPGPVRGRMDLRWALRGLARDRAAVHLVLDEGSVLRGTVDRVGADHVELAEHAAEDLRRASAVQGVRAVALDAVAVVRTSLPGWD